MQLINYVKYLPLLILFFCSCRQDETSIWNIDSEFEQALYDNQVKYSLPSYLLLVPVRSFSIYKLSDKMLQQGVVIKDEQIIREITQIVMGLDEESLSLPNDYSSHGSTDRAGYNLFLVNDSKKTYLSIPFLLFTRTEAGRVGCEFAVPPGPDAGILRSERIIPYIEHYSKEWD
jgi:hypothetical protein